MAFRLAVSPSRDEEGISKSMPYRFFSVNHFLKLSPLVEVSKYCFFVRSVCVFLTIQEMVNELSNIVRKNSSSTMYLREYDFLGKRH